MDPIDALLKRLEYQRQQASGQVSKAGVFDQVKTAFASAHLTQNKSATLEQVKLSVKQQLKKMDKQDADFSSKAFRIFVHNILAWKLGPEILNDTGFNALVYDVEQVMLQDAALKRQFESMLNELV